MFVDKNAILSWEWARVIVRIRLIRLMGVVTLESGTLVGAFSVAC